MITMCDAPHDKAIIYDKRVDKFLTVASKDIDLKFGFPAPSCKFDEVLLRTKYKMFVDSSGTMNTLNIKH